MDPAAMDFVSHRPAPGSETTTANPMAPDGQHSSPCPALRAAAAATGNQSHQPNLPIPSRAGGGSHYDPVHNTVNGGAWWPPYHPAPHNGWQQPPYPPFARSIPSMWSPPFSGAVGPSSSTGVIQGNQSAYPGFGLQDHFIPHGHPHMHAHSPPPTFHQRPTIPSLDRIGIGGAAPAQHVQNGFGAPMNAQDIHTSRVNALPALHPFAPNAAASQSQPQNNGTTSTLAPTSSTRHWRTDQPWRHSDGDRPRSGGRASSITASPNSPHADNNFNRSGGNSGAHRLRRPRISSSSSEPSSDEDPDLNDPDASALRLLETISNGGFPPAGTGSEGGIRASQLLRGSISGKRIASRSAVASLQSVKIEDLSEHERTCIICYNEFGVETPEGINEAPLRLPKCKHVFGDHCIKKWFEESDSCPYCRDKVPSEPQFRHHHPHAVLQYIRAHQAHFNRSGMNERSAGPGPTFGTLSEYYDPPLFRLGEGSPSLRTAWHSHGDRRSPSGEFEGRRRTRARHSSLRGSPPSIRPLSYAASTNTATHVFPSNGMRHMAPVHHAHRHSMGFSAPSMQPRQAFEANNTESFINSVTGDFGAPVSEQLPNPLNTFDDEPFRPRWSRSRHELASTGNDIPMTNTDQTSRSTSSQQPT